MAAQTRDRAVDRIDSPSLRPLPLKAGVTGHQGAIAVRSGAVVQPGATAANLIAVGIFDERAVGGAADGDVKAKIRRGTFKFLNAAANPVTASHVQADCYILDDQTVTSDATGRSVLGKVWAVESDGVWVTIA